MRQHIHFREMLVRRIATVLAVLLTAAFILIVTGPRVEIDPTLRFDDSAIGPDPDAYLAEVESRFADIRPGLQKEIIWADPRTKEKTPYAVIYLHGFSASKGEVRPLPDLIARHLGANLYFTRFAGHGRSSAAMGEPTANDWIQDLAEALAIGNRIGERILVMASSTGGSLAAWGAAEPGLMRNVAGLILLSPNFAVQAPGMDLLLLPWGETLARLVLGAEQESTPLNELHRQLWTWRYPVEALLPLAATMRLAQQADYSNVTIPALFILSNRDRVVNPAATKSVISRWGAPHELILIDESGDPGMHVLAGDARSPATTGAIAQDIIGWIGNLP